MRTFFLVFTLSLAALLSLPADPFDDLRQRTVDFYTGGSGYDPNDPVLGPRLQELVRRVAENGTSRTPGGKGYWDSMELGPQRTNRLWRDIGRLTFNYTKVGDSITRLGEMARVYAMPGSPLYQNKELARDIIEAIDFCLAQNYNETHVRKGWENWFALELGIPLRLLPMLMMLHDEIPPEKMAYYLKVVDHFAPFPDKIGGHDQPATGANLAWKARVVAMSAILAKDANRLASVGPALDPLWETVTSGDGFYSDGSFIQHRHFAYTGGYGTSAVGEPLLLVAMLEGTPWALPPERTRQIVERLDQGFAPLVVRGEMMDMVRGREISRAAQESVNAGAGVTRIYLRALDLVPEKERPAYESRLKGWIEQGTYFGPLSATPGTLLEDVRAREIQKNSTFQPAPEPRAHHVFAGMDRVVHRAGDWAAGLSLYSSRVANYELINGENRRGWHTSSGHLALYLGEVGQFSHGFWPTVDAERLPGVTWVAGSRPGTERSRTPFVGGAGLPDGSLGVAALKLDSAAEPDLRGKKSWFFFSDAIVCLGSGLSAGPGARLETTVENRRLEDPAAAWENAPNPAKLPLQPAPAKPETLRGVRHAHLAGKTPATGLGFVFPEPTDLLAVRESRTDAWTSVSTTSLLPVPGDPITRDYLTVWMDHGVSPKDADYAYILLPRATVAETAAFAGQPRYVVLANTPSVQAVGSADGKMFAAVFWAENGGAVAVGSRAITTSGPGLFLFSETPDGLTVAAADPTQKQTEEIRITLGRTVREVRRGDDTLTVEPGSDRLRFRPAGLRGRTATAVLQ